MTTNDIYVFLLKQVRIARKGIKTYMNMSFIHFFKITERQGSTATSNGLNLYIENAKL